MTMTLLLVLSAWMLVLWLATGLCAAARLGDLAQPEDVSAAFGQGHTHEAWEQGAPVTIAARAEIGIGRDGAPLSSGSLAA
jgi:hypothetical protein